MSQNQNWQNQVAEFAQNHNLSGTVGVYLLDLVSEVGEMAKEHLKSTEYGQRLSTPASDRFSEELGDVLFSLCLVAHHAGVDLDNALQTVLQKYTNRWENSGDIGSTPIGASDNMTLK